MADSVNVSDVDDRSRLSRPKDGLDFQDIDYEMRDPRDQSQTHVFIQQPDTMIASDEDDKTELLDRDKRTSPSYWSFEYYQQFFDVETATVCRRILGSMIPLPHRNFLHTKIRPNPDLYGPFWVCTTLVFTIAIVGNIVTMFDPHRVQNFSKVTYAATAIYSYWWLVPCCLFTLLWWRGSRARYTLLEIISLYGYSLSVFIPISILWVMPWSGVQWALAVLGALLSGSVLVISFIPLLHGEGRNIAIVSLILIFLCHSGLAVGLRYLSATLDERTTIVVPTNSSAFHTTRSSAFHTTRS